MSDEVNDFLKAGGAPSAKFPQVGSSVTGRVVDSKKTQQSDIDGKPQFYEDGNPKEQVVITLRTDERNPEIVNDDGTRALYVKNQMRAALREALRNANADLAEGGTLTVTWVGEKPSEHRGYSPAKQYAATYAPPTAGAVASGLFADNEEPF